MTEPIAGFRQNTIHRRLHLDLPIPAVGLEAEQSNVGDVHGMLAVDSDKPVILERDHHITDRSDVDEWRARTQTDFGFPTPGPQELHVIRVEHPVLTAGDMNEDSMRCHTSVVVRLGHHAHGLVVHRMVWSSGE